MREEEYLQEKEKAIKDDLDVLENRIRHAYNQGVQMGQKLERAKKGDKWLLEYGEESGQLKLTKCQVTDDAISREEVIEMIMTDPVADSKLHLVEKVKHMKYVMPTKKTGRWIQEDTGWWHCSHCKIGKYARNVVEDMVYCPKCGSRNPMD